MTAILEIDDPQEIERFAQFLKEMQEAKAIEKLAIRKKVLGELFAEERIQLPPDYKFDRESLYVRSSIR